MPSITSANSVSIRPQTHSRTMKKKKEAADCPIFLRSKYDVGGVLTVVNRIAMHDIDECVVCYSSFPSPRLHLCYCIQQKLTIWLTPVMYLSDPGKSWISALKCSTRTNGFLPIKKLFLCCYTELKKNLNQTLLSQFLQFVQVLILRAPECNTTNTPCATLRMPQS